MPVTRSRLASALLKLASLKSGGRRTTRRAPRRRTVRAGMLGLTNLVGVGAGRHRRPGRPRKPGRPKGSALVGGAPVGGRRRVYRRRR